MTNTFLSDIIYIRQQQYNIVLRALDNLWRVVRVVEGARLESVYTGYRIEGSNPSLSAIKFSEYSRILVIQNPAFCYIYCF